MLLYIAENIFGMRLSRDWLLKVVCDIISHPHNVIVKIDIWSGFNNVSVTLANGAFILHCS